MMEEHNWFIKSIKTIGITTLIWGIIFLCTVIVLLVTYFISPAISYDIKRLVDGISILIAGILITKIGQYRLHYVFTKISETARFTKYDIKWFFRITAICFFSYLSFFLISYFFNAYKFIELGTNYYSYFDIIKHYLLFAICANAFASIGEELIFRGFLLNYLDNLFKYRLSAIIVSSFIFAVGHLQYEDLTNYLIAFLAGITMSYGYLKFGTLLLPIGIHFSYNLFNLVIASDPGRGPQMPYIFKFNYIEIFKGFGGWVDLFIMLSFVVILGYLIFKRHSLQIINNVRCDQKLDKTVTTFSIKTQENFNH